jgi:AcrR family transcriptional regulator
MILTTTKQIERRQRIEKAAYEVLKEAGYKGASLLLIAQRASVSNETLYRWYGNKQALFRTLVEENARGAKALLEEGVGNSSQPIITLSKLSPLLLGVVTGDKAITLNRAAAGDVSDTATLGQSISLAGRDTLAPLVRRLLDLAIKQLDIHCDDPADATATYFNLLIGDLQIRRVIGVIGPLTKSEIAKRSNRAMQQFLQIYGTEKSPNSRLGKSQP